MAYDLLLADRIRILLTHVPEVEEKAMMGGLTFMVNGKMCVGIIKDELMCRIDPSTESELLRLPGCRPMDFTGRPMKGYVMVDPLGMGRTEELQAWIERCLDFNERARPSKKRKAAPKKSKGEEG